MEQKILSRLPIHENKQITDEHISWKDILTGTLSASDQAIQSQRAWGQFTSSMRNLCPETEWLFIREENSNKNDSEALKVISTWMSKLVTNSDWPFPERIIFSSENNMGETIWKIAFVKTEGALPVSNPPTSLAAIPWHDQYSHGWKISVRNSITLNKTGSA